MAPCDEHAPIEVDNQQKKKNPVWKHVVNLNYVLFHIKSCVIIKKKSSRSCVTVF